MSDLIKVNILSSGRIPWMNITGPRYGISISKRLYTLLKNDPNVRIEIADKPAEAPKKEAFNVVDSVVIKENKTEVESIKINEPVESTVENDVSTDEIVANEIEETIQENVEDPVIDPMDITVEEDVTSIEEDVDEEIEKELEHSVVEEFPDVAAEVMKEEIIDGDEIVDVDFRVYTEEELSKMSKEELKTILSVERNYTSGENAPKYADNKTILISKILKTQ